MPFQSGPKGPNPNALPYTVQQQAPLIKRACVTHSVPVPVFMGMYYNETRWGQNVSTSTASAVGPFQFTAADKGTGVMYPMTNTPTLQEFGQQANAAAAYLKLIYDTQAGHNWSTALEIYSGNTPGYAAAAMVHGNQLPADWATALGAPVGAGGGGNSNDTSGIGFTVGDASNPNEDYWTAINRLSAERYWYVFSDAESVYLTDGPDLMKQAPVASVDRIRDIDRLPELSLTIDNTAWNYVATHKKRVRSQRRTNLAKVTSPVEASMHLICNIDSVRAGDIVFLSSAGPGDGGWMVGDARRSFFQVHAELTLVLPLQPLTESELNSAGQNPNNPSDGGNSPSGSSGNYASPFTKKLNGNTGIDMGVDFGAQNGLSTGSPILAIGDCYCRSISTFYAGQPGMWFELTDKSRGYWGWYVAEQINPSVGPGPALIKGSTQVATFAAGGTGIEIGWAAAPGVTATEQFHPSEVAPRHAGRGTTDGNNFFAFLKSVGAQ